MRTARGVSGSLCPGHAGPGQEGAGQQRAARLLLLLLLLLLLTVFDSRQSNNSSNKSSSILRVSAFSTTWIGNGSRRRNRNRQRRPISLRRAVSSDADDHPNANANAKTNATRTWRIRLEETFRNSNSTTNNSSKQGSFMEQDRPLPTAVVTTYTNVLEFLECVEENPPSNKQQDPDDNLLIVLFFSYYCRTCPRATLSFQRLAYELSSSSHTSSSYQFVLCETSALTPQHYRALLGSGSGGVPQVHIYRQSLCVASFSVAATTKRPRTTPPTRTTTTMRRSLLRARVLDQIAQCQQRSRTASWSTFLAVHADAIDHNRRARQHLQRDLILPSTPESEDERGYGAVRTLTSEADLLDLLRPTTWRSADEEDTQTEETEKDNTNVVILFHNQFEPAACLRAQHKYRKLAQELQVRPPANQHWCLARIEISVLSASTLRWFGIANYPHLQVYTKDQRHHRRNSTASASSSSPTRPYVCVASFSIPHAYLFTSLVRASCQQIASRTRSDWNDFYHHQHEEIQAQAEALARMRQQQEQEQQ